MKKIVFFLTAIILCFSISACGAKDPAVPADPADSVTISVPAELAGITSEKDLKDQFSGDGYLDARLTDEGVVLLTMTREKHTALVADTERSIRESLDAMTAAEDNRFTKIEVNGDFTHYTVYLPGEELQPGENFYTISLLFSSDLYYVVLGQEVPEVTVDYVNELSGEVIYTYPETAEG